MSTFRLTRRDFVAATAAGALLGSNSALGATGKRRVALVGTGVRGSGFCGKFLNDNYSDVIEYAGLCDIKPGRLQYAKEFMGVDCPAFTDFDAMLAQAKPVVLIDGQLRVNGQSLGDTDMEQFGERTAYLNLRDGGGPDVNQLEIPAGMVLALGDHRGNSLDGRFLA